jgi:hypothetical protein
MQQGWEEGLQWPKAPPMNPGPTESEYKGRTGSAPGKDPTLIGKFNGQSTPPALLILYKKRGIGVSHGHANRNFAGGRHLASCEYQQQDQKTRRASSLICYLYFIRNPARETISHF